MTFPFIYCLLPQFRPVFPPYIDLSVGFTVETWWESSITNPDSLVGRVVAPDTMIQGDRKVKKKKILTGREKDKKRVWRYILCVCCSVLSLCQFRELHFIWNALFQTSRFEREKEREREGNRKVKWIERLQILRIAKSKSRKTRIATRSLSLSHPRRSRSVLFRTVTNDKLCLVSRPSECCKQQQKSSDHSENR